MVRLERIAGYEDLVTDSDQYRWRRGQHEHEPPGDRPVLAQDIRAWLMYAVVDRETTERLRAFSFEAVTKLLAKDGWKSEGVPSHYNYDSTGTTVQGGLAEEWRFDKQEPFGSSKTSIHERVIAPRGAMHDDRRVWHFWHILAIVQKVRYSDKFEKVTIPELIAEVESMLHPLVQLAMQAEP